MTYDMKEGIQNGAGIYRKVGPEWHRGASIRNGMRASITKYIAMRFHMEIAFLFFHVVLTTAGLVTPNCTFDSDLCGWTHGEISPNVKNNTWIRENEETLTWKTGPSVDHTFGTFEGKNTEVHYFYRNSIDFRVLVGILNCQELLVNGKR